MAKLYATVTLDLVAKLALELIDVGSLRAPTTDDAESAESRFNLGAIRAARGELDEARRLYREALALDPELTAARHELERLGSSGDTDASRKN